MPIYEYEPWNRECFMCEGRVSVIQGLDEPELEFCPQCGLKVRRVISRASIQIRRGGNLDKAAQHGLTAWKRVEEGKWEKVAGDGVDMIVGSAEDIQAVKDEKSAKPVIDLDKS